MRKLLKYYKENKYIVALAIVTIIVGIFHFVTNDGPFDIWLKQSSANLFITILGIWVTVFCIDRIIKKKEQREKDRLLHVAYLEIHRAMNFYLFSIDRLYRASSADLPEFKETYKEMYNSDHFRDAFLNCDFSSKLKDWDCTWGQYLDFKTKDFILDVQNALNKYSLVIDPTITRQLEMLKGSSFCFMASQMENPSGRKEVIYKFYNDFLNQLSEIALCIIHFTKDQKFYLFHSSDLWYGEHDLEAMGSARIQNFK